MLGSHISVVSVPVRNAEVAKHFYIEKLGFELIMETEFGSGLRWVMLRPPGGGSAVTLVTWFETMPAGTLRGTVLSVPDIEAAAAHLREVGLLEPEDEIESAPWGRFVTVEDPDGNGWVVQQDAPGRVDLRP